MNIKQEKICRLCLGATKNKFEVIDDITKEMLDVLLLKTNLDISEEPLICKNCAGAVQKSFYFKSVCIETEELVYSFAASKRGIKIELKHVYEDRLIENIVDEKVIICRFCMCQFEVSEVVTMDVLRNNEIFRKMLPAYMPEVDVNVTDDPVVCTYCRKNLKCYFKLAHDCCDTEEKITRYYRHQGTNGEGKVNLSGVRDFLIEGTSEYLDKCAIKQEKEFVSYNDLLNFDEELYIKIKAFSLVENDCQSPIIVRDENSGDATMPKMYNCDTCTFKTIYKYSLESHKRIHKKTSEVKMFKCAMCPYETKWKHHIKGHSVVHQDASRVEALKCSMCSFKTIRKDCLKRHMIIHKDTSQVQMYKCAHCSFETKYRKNLKSHFRTHQRNIKVKKSKCTKKGDLKLHMPIHTDTSQVYTCTFCFFETKYKRTFSRHILAHKGETKYKNNFKTTFKCTMCPYETKWKHHIRTHSVIHQDASEAETFKCATCSFETKHKDCIKRHMIIHKDISQVQMYKCAHCSFETKYKKNLRSHLLLHQPVSHVKKYKCERCVYKTRTKGNLKLHMRTHKDTLETYKCAHCTFETKYKRSLSSHLLCHQSATKGYDAVF